MEKRIAEIIARMKAIDTEQEGIERKASLENAGAFTDETRAQYETLQGEYDNLKNEKERLEKDASLLAGRSGRATDFEPKAIERKTQPGSGAPAIPSDKPVSGQPVDRSVGMEINSPDAVKFKIPRNVLRVQNPRNFKGTVDGASAEERAYRFGQYCLAKLSNDLPHRYQFPDSQKFVNDYMGGIRNTAHGEDATTGGHFLVPEEFSSDLIVLRETYGVARRIFGREVMTSDTKHIPKRSSGLTAYFVNESDQITESNMTWSDVLLVAKDLGAIARMSNQLSADAVITVGDNLAGEISYAFANKEDDCAFNGTGTSTYGGIRGAAYLLDNIAGTTTDSKGLIVQGTGNTWGAIVAGDLTNVVGILPQFADTPNACWVVHRAFYYGVMEKLLLAAGGVTAMEVNTGDRRPRPIYLGYPVEFSQIMPSTTAVATVCALLGDFSLGAVLGDRQQTSIMFSEHAYVNSQSVFERNQIAVRGTERFDIVVHGYGDASNAGPIVGLKTGA